LPIQTLDPGRPEHVRLVQEFPGTSEEAVWLREAALNEVRLRRTIVMLDVNRRSATSFLASLAFDVGLGRHEFVVDRFIVPSSVQGEVNRTLSRLLGRMTDELMTQFGDGWSYLLWLAPDRDDLPTLEFHDFFEIPMSEERRRTPRDARAVWGMLSPLD
jgi:hypothetical protein